MKRLLCFCLLLMLAAAAHARVERRVPATFVLSDDYDHFIGPTVVSSGHGKFDVSLGESHEGDPGFEGSEPGAEFEYAVVIYHLQPSRQPLPYLPKYVPVARGKHRQSVMPLFKGSKKVRFQGVDFTISIQKLSFTYGAGRTRVQVTAADS
ncbi:MAG: hypothetical protein FJX76_06015 [Armatimonadetes bacterium]|nr:hypothetical protein [Armatimonadota bacterium]